jgi:error-prone DNA polymerase
MLTCIRKAFALIERHRGRAYALATIPAERPEVYAMLSRGDSIGVFQVESRAQMTMLPRLKPREFYDLVIEVAIVRPGPIQGDMVHPYLRRRSGKEPISYPSAALRRVLEKTLGVPLFQEQAMKIAIVGAGFPPAEADRLRRAMATFKRNGDIHLFRDKFVAGMVKNGYARDFAERCFGQIEGFGTYGFPESHAASFALLVYVSAWIKCVHPEAFACALLNSQPMGFYAPAQIVRDAREHGVTVLPADVNHSDWDCTLEDCPADGASFETRSASAPQDDGLGGWHEEERHPEEPATRVSRRTHSAAPAPHLALRLGLRQIKGFSEADAKKLVAARGAGYADAGELWRRSGLGRAALERLAAADALRSLGLDRRQGLWALKALGEAPLPLFAATSTVIPEQPTGPNPEPMHTDGEDFAPVVAPPINRRSSWVPGSLAARAPRNDNEGSETSAAALLPAMPLGEHVVEDYATTSLSLKRHPVAFLRPELARDGIVPAAALATLPVERRIAVAGLVLIRQRPGSAKGVIFVTIEDETGVANLIVWPPILERFRRIVLGAGFLYCRGKLQREEGVIHVVADELKDLTPRLRTLRDRGDPPIRASAPPPVPSKRGRALSPLADPRDIYIPDIIIQSRDFR